MAWPKGVSRKGYVKKDGVAIAKKGTIKRDKVEKADPIIEPPVLHGMVGDGAITQPCPNCLYAYADGGWCKECGWTAYTRIDPAGTHSGGKLNANRSRNRSS